MIERFRAGDIRQDAFSYYRRLGQVKRYCEGHYADDLPLERVAAVAHLEKSYFSTFFHDKVGVTFHDWLRYVRITAAQELMRDSNLTITDVATRVGFNDLGTFERAFRFCTGKTPTQYQNVAGD